MKKPLSSLETHHFPSLLLLSLCNHQPLHLISDNMGHIYNPLLLYKAFKHRSFLKTPMAPPCLRTSGLSENSAVASTTDGMFLLRYKSQLQHDVPSALRRAIVPAAGWRDSGCSCAPTMTRFPAISLQQLLKVAYYQSRISSNSRFTRRFPTSGSAATMSSRGSRLTLSPR